MNHASEGQQSGTSSAGLALVNKLLAHFLRPVKEPEDDRGDAVKAREKDGRWYSKCTLLATDAHPSSIHIWRDIYETLGTCVGSCRPTSQGLKWWIERSRHRFVRVGGGADTILWILWYSHQSAIRGGQCCRVYPSWVDQRFKIFKIQSWICLLIYKKLYKSISHYKLIKIH